MGCASSAPDVILDDPGEMEPIKVSIKSKMMGMSEDYNAVNEAGQPWFFINKTGSFFGSGNCIVELENFKTGSNPEKPKKGEVLWTAKFNQTPRFDQMMKPKTGAYQRYAPAFQSLLAGDFQAAFRAAGSSGQLLLRRVCAPVGRGEPGAAGGLRAALVPGREAPRLANRRPTLSPPR